MDHVGIVGQCMHQGSVWNMGRCALGEKIRHFKKVCQSRKDQVVHKVEVEVSQEEGKIEEVSINSVCLNNKQSLITAQL